LTFASLVFCSFGAFYVGYYVLAHSIVPALSGGDVATTVGVYLLAWLILSIGVLAAALQVNGVAVVVFGSWSLAYRLLVIGHLVRSPNVVTAGGAVAIATAAAAWYASAAFLINETYRRRVLPLFEAGPDRDRLLAQARRSLTSLRASRGLLRRH
jgi:succinate-acetate transporter protein